MNTLDTGIAGKQEGKVTTAIEARTSRVPSLAFMGLAIGSMIASAALMASRRRHMANFVGQWAPTLLIIGLYNKVVKLERELGVEEEARTAA